MLKQTIVNRETLLTLEHGKHYLELALSTQDGGYQVLQYRTTKADFRQWVSITGKLQEITAWSNVGCKNVRDIVPDNIDRQIRLDWIHRMRTAVRLWEDKQYS